MSLISLLLGSDQSSDQRSEVNVNVDDELDSLFRSNPAPPAVLKPNATPIFIPDNSSPSKESSTRGQKRKRQQETFEKLPRTATDSKTVKRKKSGKIVKISEILSEDRNNDNNEDTDKDEDEALEMDYLNRRTSAAKKLSEGEVQTEPSEGETDDSHAPLPKHETHANLRPTRTRLKTFKKTKYVPADETPEQRDARTIFVGNVPVEVVKSKSSQKQLKRHFISLISGSKIESIRFRSVAFASATSTLSNEGDVPGPKPKPVVTPRAERQQERTAQWRKGGGDGTSDQEDKPALKVLTPAARKRVAFIKGEFHEGVDVVNSYIVFAHPEPASESGTPVQTEGANTMKRTKPLTIQPVDAARLAVEQVDGTTFLGHTIRVDRVGQWRVGSTDASKDPGATGIPSGDLRLTLFVGNLDFAAKEEDLRVWFEGVVSQERGPPGRDEESAEESSSKEGGDEQWKGNSKLKAWVRSVRIVRDRDTQLGKGFAYVQFVDRECVDEVLGLESSKLKFAKRTLRIQRCKVNPGAAKETRQNKKQAPAPKEKRTSKTIPAVSVPKGDPALGDRLMGLSKDERKAVKAANVDRVKRRLAKKKAKASVERAAAGKDRQKDRGRQRKGKGEAIKAKKGRMRSEKSVGKRNEKK